MTTDHVTATAARHHRAQAARTLCAAPGREALSWAALSHCPAWIFADTASRDALAWRLGAWRHRATWQRCIDGRVLERLHLRLGEAAFAELMATGAGDTQAPPLHDPSELTDDTLQRHGREWMLASLDDEALRRCVHALWWPDLPLPDHTPSSAHAARGAMAWATAEAAA